MKLDPSIRQIIQEEIDAAHNDATTDGKFRSREVAAALVHRLEDMQRFGAPWVRAYLRDLAITGAMRPCADFRRRGQVAARTKRGKRVLLPLFTAAGRDAQGRPVQGRFDDLTLAQLAAKRNSMAKTRDTYSAEVATYDALMAFMAANPQIRTTGEARAAMERAA